MDSLSLVNQSQNFETTLYKEVAQVKTQVMPGATNEEFSLFIKYCSKYQLNPLAKQIYAISRPAKNQFGEWEKKWTYQTSIEGYRLIAERTGLYEGQTLPLFCGQDGEWKELWTSFEFPFACKIGVYKKGFREPVWAIGRFVSYVQKNKAGKVNSMWNKMPDIMLAKCTEAQALRKAFPNDLSGVYTNDIKDEENFDAQVLNENEFTVHDSNEKYVSFDEISKLNFLRIEAGKRDTYLFECLERLGKESLGELTLDEYQKIKLRLERDIAEIKTGCSVENDGQLNFVKD